MLVAGLPYPISGGGTPTPTPASSVWTLDTTWTPASSPTDEHDMILSQDRDELLIIVDGVTAGSYVRGYVSTDGGSTFFGGSTDYQPITNDGFLSGVRGELFFMAGAGLRTAVQN
ncbi:hypothetical protein GCM10010989_09620 [Croceicoccus pelagius]|uniref:Uncharacterized protein n=2 Tax=Croceicoccus pelagius TaxID=1703341 RepID=A0A917DG84_9SPHN|nr:hypothetical protein GCM10010989_09620 [Croceicoccus pelagius]